MADSAGQMKFVTPFTLIAMMFLVLGGGLVGAGAVGNRLVLLALGAGWHGLLYASAQRILAECRGSSNEGV